MLSNSCPQIHILRLFCEGNLSSDRIDDVADHISVCTACMAEVDNLIESPGPSDGLIGTLRGAVTADRPGAENKRVTQADEDAIIASVDYVEIVSLKAIHGQEIFQCFGEIGRGPFGSVILATDSFDNRIAIKLPFRHLVASREHWKRFFMDAKSLKEVQHPSIVPVYQFGMWDDRRTYLTMPLVSSPSLKTFLESTSELTIELSRTIFQQVCGAIHVAHDQPTPIWHRHLNPNNIFVHSEQHVQVGDFGFLFDERYQFDLIRRHEKACPFMSPECKAMDEKRMDHRSDIYSLGTLLALLMSRTTGLSSCESQHFRRLATRCRSQSRRLRPDTVAEVLEMAIL